MRLIENKQELLRNLHLLLTTGLCLFPLLSHKAMGSLVIVWSVVTLAGVLILPKSISRKRLGLALLFSAPFLLTAIYTLINGGREAGFELERTLSLLIIPWLWALWPERFSDRQLGIIRQVFTLACFAAVIKVLAVMLLTDFQLAGHHFNYAFRTRFEDISGKHPTYMSVMLLFTVLLTGTHWWKNRTQHNWATQGFQWLILLTCFGATLLLASRTPLLVFLLAGTLGLIIFSPRKWLTVGVLTGLALIGILALTQFPSISTRMQEITTKNLAPPRGRRVNSVNLRAGIWRCAWKTGSENPVFGVGTGQVQMALNSCYSRYKTSVYRTKDYNTHNQYFHYWLSIGLLGLIAFILALIWPMILSARGPDPVYFVLLVFFAGCCLTENLLLRLDGVLFYALFNSLYAFQGKLQRP